MNNGNNTSNHAVMVFCRDYLIDDFKEMVAAHSSDFTFHFLTDGTYTGITDTKQRFYARLSSASKADGWSDEDENDAVARCRLLRGLERKQAFQMLRSMISVLSEELDRINPAFVFAQMVDEYITYLLAELARRRGIKYLGICYSYFPERMQVTQYWNGIPHNFRGVSDSEATDTLKMISQRTFRQNYLQKNTYTKRRHFIAVTRYKIKSMLFPVLAFLKRDPLNIHYKCLPFVVERRRLSDFPTQANFHTDWKKVATDTALQNGKPILYMPLAYFPESTIDYWISNKLILDYQKVTLEICRTLGLHFNVLIKEHLHMLGARDKKFYEELKNINGVISVPPLEFSHDVSELAKVIVIGGGSIGVESCVRDKPVATFCDTSYWFQPSGASYLDLSELDKWPQILKTLIESHHVKNELQKVEFIQQCLKSTLTIDKQGKVWAIPLSQDVARLFETA